MKVRDLASMSATGFLGVLLIFTAAEPANSQPEREVLVEAQPDPNVLTAYVNFSISDIRSPMGQDALVRRVHAATYEVCPVVSGGSDDARQTCANQSWAEAKPQVDRAIHRAMNIADVGAPMSISIGIAAAK